MSARTGYGIQDAKCTRDCYCINLPDAARQSSIQLRCRAGLVRAARPFLTPADQISYLSG